MATSLLVLLDDIASVLDDVAVLTKVAARTTAAVLGDDLAGSATPGADAARLLLGPAAERALSLFAEHYSLTADDVPNTASGAGSGTGSGSIRVRWLILTQALSAAADCCSDDFRNGQRVPIVCADRRS